MKRYGVGIALAWILATAASVLAATTAVDAVRDRVTDRPSALVNAAEGIGSSLEPADVGDGSRPTVPATLPPVTTDAAEGEEDLDPVPLTGTSLDATTTSDTATNSSTSSSSTNAPTTGQTTAASSSSITATTSSPPASTPQPTATTTNPPPPPTTPTTTAPTTTTTEANRTTSVYVVDGGTVRIRIDEAQSEVKLMGTIPKTGFRASVLESGPTEVLVEFRSNSITSSFWAYFEDGELVVEAD